MWKIIRELYVEIVSYTKYSVLLNDSKLDKKSKNVFFLMNSIFFGFFISFLFGSVTALLIYIFSEEIFASYIRGFFIEYNCFITGGLSFGLAYQVYKMQDFIPNLLSEVFTKEKLLKNKIYTRHKKTYFSIKSSMRISTIHIILSFILFYYAKFPYQNKIAENAMIIYACAIIACGVYIGRKIFYVALMLQSIENIKLEKDIFSDDRLGGITTYVNVITTFTVLAIWFCISSYYSGPFEFNTQLGDSIKIFMFYPAIIAMPVLIIFNYYPKTLIRQLYTKSINIKIDLLKNELNAKKEINEFEKIQYLSEVDKISRDELKYKLRLALNDLPLIITIVIMLISLIV